MPLLKPSWLPAEQAYAAPAWHQSLSDGETGAAVLVPRGLTALTLTLTPAAAASGKVQYTTASVEAVAADTATWRDWPLGVVSAAADDVLLGPVTAVRGVSVAGAVEFAAIGA